MIFKPFRATTLQRFIFREFFIIFLMALFASTLLFLTVSLFQLHNEYGQTGTLVFLLPFLTPKTLGWSIPLAALIASTMVFSRMTAEDEILAAQAGGASLGVLTAPILICALILSGLCLWNNQAGIAWGNSMIRNKILNVDNPEKFFETLNRPGTSLSVPMDKGSTAHINLLPLVDGSSPGAVRHPIHIAIFQNQWVSMNVLAKDFKSKVLTQDHVLKLTLLDAQLIGSSPGYFDEITMEIPQPSIATLIDLGTTRGQIGWLDNYRDAIHVRQSLDRRRAFVRSRACEFAASVIGGSYADPSASFLAAKTWSDTRSAAEAIYAAGGAVDQIRGDYVECWRKIAMSLLPISMIVLGIGLGLYVKKSQRLFGLLSSLLLYGLVYYPLMLVAKELAVAGSLGVVALWVPNVVLFILGYFLCFKFERGMPAFDVPAILVVVAEDLVNIFNWAYKHVSKLHSVGSLIFHRKTDGYIGGAFLVPLSVVLVTFCSIFTAFDFAEHGSDVVEGILRCADPNPGIPSRHKVQAICDVLSYYGIGSLGLVCDLLPLLILTAGLLCVFVLIRNNEHLIMKSAGVPLQRALRPVILLAIALSIIVTCVRETIMPQLLMYRAYLRPLVYNRSPAPNAIALYTKDSSGHPVIFEMSEYASSSKSGKDLCIYFLNPSERRIESITADIAYWNGDCWKLQTDPNKTAQNSKKAPVEFSGAGALPLINHGYRVVPKIEESGDPLTREVEKVVYNKAPIESWRGTITPSFLESERLGSGVMRLSELAQASSIRPEFAADWWQRACEVIMGLLLLWTTIPFLLNETHSPLTGVGYGILVALCYWVLNYLCLECGKSMVLPAWAPLLPHVWFLFIGYKRYYVTMAT